MDAMPSHVETDYLPGIAPRTVRGFNADIRGTRAAMLADTLAWAVSHDIPMTEALSTVPVPEGRYGPVGFLAFCPSWIKRPLLRLIPDGGLWRSQWAVRLADLRQGLEAGEPLGSALRRTMARYFPRYFLTGVEEAEQQGHLATALPVLARYLSVPMCMARRQKEVWTYVLIRIWVGMSVVGFVCTNVVPKFEEIFLDLAGRELPYAMGVLQGQLLESILHVTLLCLLGGYALGKMGAFGEMVLLRVPLVGRARRRLYFYELARSMAAFTAQGEDIVVAAEWSSKSSRSAWLRRRLRRFVEAVRSGTKWTDAWERLYVGKPVERWIIRNAAAREDVVSGFDLLAEWLADELRTAARVVRMCVEPIFTILLGIVVGLLAYGFVSFMAELCYSLV